MIPYALLMINIIWNDGSSLPVRALELYPDGFTFRVAEKRAQDFHILPCRWEFLFTDVEAGHIGRVSVTDFHLEPHGNGFLFTSEQADFLAELNALSDRYLKYINLHLQEDELTAMEQMTGRPLSGNYPASLDAWKNAWAPSADYSGEQITPVLPGEIAYSLDNIHMWEAFGTMDPQSFHRFYLKENHLEHTVFAKAVFTHIYIGNQFCPLLFPDTVTLKGLLNKAAAAGLIPVIALSTMPEYLVDSVRRQIEELASCHRAAAEQEPGSPPLELVVNDMGIALMIREMGLTCFRITAGILLNKRKKDVRTAWTGRPDTSGEVSGNSSAFSSMDADFYRQYLADAFDIRAISYESASFPFTARSLQDGMDTIVHLPLFQMNTAGFCTMYAMCANGSRGRQEEVHSCPHYCEDHAFVYSDNLPIIGLYNSLFGCDPDVLTDISYLNRLAEHGIKRIVVRF